MPMTQREEGSYVRGENVHIYGSFKYTASGNLVDTIRDGNSRIIASVTRVSAGLYEVQIDTSGFPIPERLVVARAWVNEAAAYTKSMKAHVVESGTGAYSQSTRKFRLTTIRDGAVPAYTTGVTVTANSTGALPNAGPVLLVTGTAGTVTGEMILMSIAPVRTRTAQVTYAAGVPTVNFLAGDAVTACTVLQLGGTPDDPDDAARICFELVGSISSPGTDPA